MLTNAYVNPSVRHRGHVVSRQTYFVFQCCLEYFEGKDVITRIFGVPVEVLMEFAAERTGTCLMSKEQWVAALEILVARKLIGRLCGDDWYFWGPRTERAEMRKEC